MLLALNKATSHMVAESDTSAGSDCNGSAATALLIIVLSGNHAGEYEIYAHELDGLGIIVIGPGHSANNTTTNNKLDNNDDDDNSSSSSSSSSSTSNTSSTNSTSTSSRTTKARSNKTNKFSTY